MSKQRGQKGLQRVTTRGDDTVERNLRRREFLAKKNLGRHP